MVLVIPNTLMLHKMSNFTLTLFYQGANAKTAPTTTAAATTLPSPAKNAPPVLAPLVPPSSSETGALVIAVSGDIIVPSTTFGTGGRVPPGTRTVGLPVGPTLPTSPPRNMSPEVGAVVVWRTGVGAIERETSPVDPTADGAAVVAGTAETATGAS